MAVCWSKFAYCFALTSCMASTRTAVASKKSTEEKHHTAKDSRFIPRLKKLLAILFPKVWCKASLVLAVHSLALISRTLLSIYVALLDGSIVRALVDQNVRQFLLLLLKWLGLGVVGASLNSVIRFLENSLALCFRTTLTRHSLNQYMTSENYYRVGNLDGRMENPDQCLTEDIWQFCRLVSHLYSHISKPVLDIALITLQLIRRARSKGTGLRSPVLFAAISVGGTSKLLRALSPRFGALAKRQAMLAGRYRFVHSRLIANAEEVAFYGGHAVERSALMRAYSSLAGHMRGVYRQRMWYGAVEDFLLKYTWSACGYMLVAYQAFYSADAASSSTSERTQDYITARGLLVNAADAIGRVMSSYKEVTELAGYTHRVCDMLQVLRDCSDGQYQRPSLAQDSGKQALLRGRGAEEESESVTFSGVPIVSPIGDVLVESLDFSVDPGMHLLITGPNGCGKSSLFRILGGLWPAYAGTMLRPAQGDVLYIPQRPYLSLGTLRDQVVYPHSAADMAAAGVSDADLMAIMARAHLQYIVDREGGWDAVKPWADTLSGGEKQRVGLARLFYHRPRFAILDECTSAVSIDVEGEMYQYAKDIGITLLTVTHRPSLWKFHDYLLKFDGEGGWRFSALSFADDGTMTITDTACRSAPRILRQRSGSGSGGGSGGQGQGSDGSSCGGGGGGGVGDEPVTVVAPPPPTATAATTTTTPAAATTTAAASSPAAAAAAEEAAEAEREALQLLRRRRLLHAKKRQLQLCEQRADSLRQQLAQLTTATTAAASAAAAAGGGGGGGTTTAPPAEKQQQQQQQQ